jgi:hypothetical protein
MPGWIRYPVHFTCWNDYGLRFFSGGKKYESVVLGSNTIDALDSFELQSE